MESSKGWLFQPNFSSQLLKQIHDKQRNDKGVGCVTPLQIWDHIFPRESPQVRGLIACLSTT